MCSCHVHASSCSNRSCAVLSPILAVTAVAPGGIGYVLQAKAEAVAAAKDNKQPMSHAQRSLAKANKKGMKSIASFFKK